MATPAQIQFEDKDLTDRASYEDLQHGEDYLATLISVEDIVARSGNPGWAFNFQVNGLPLTTRVYHLGGGKWKIREVFNALGQPINPGDEIGVLDPDSLVGNVCVVTIAKELRDETDPSQGYWTNIGRHTPYVTEPTPSL